MQRPAPPVFPVFRSALTVGVLAHVFIGGGEYSVTELAASIGTFGGNITREVSRLEQAGIVRSRHIGRSRLVSANTEAPFYRALLELVVITLGPQQILAEEIGDLPGIERAEIFGSWAARMKGEAGPSPADIDLLVIGRPDRDDLHEATGRAAARLGREVNNVVVSAERWAAAEDGFLRELQNRPRVVVLGPAEGKLE